MDDRALRATIGLSASEFNQLAQRFGPEIEKEFYYHQHIRYGLTLLPFGTLLPSVTTSYMLGTYTPLPLYIRTTHNITGGRYGAGSII